MRRKQREMNTNEKAMLSFIRAYIKQHGISPTIREICDGLHLTSTSIAHYYLDRLERRGVIRRQRGKSRSITLVAFPSSGGVQFTLDKTTTAEPLSASGEYMHRVRVSAGDSTSQRLKAFTGWGKTPESARAQAADELLKWLEAEVGA